MCLYYSLYTFKFEKSQRCLKPLNASKSWCTRRTVLEGGNRELSIRLRSSEIKSDALSDDRWESEFSVRRTIKKKLKLKVNEGRKNLIAGRTFPMKSFSTLSRPTTSKMTQCFLLVSRNPTEKKVSIYVPGSLLESWFGLECPSKAKPTRFSSKISSKSTPTTTTT